MLSAEYIVGLTDGEGSFTAYLRPPNKKHRAKNWRVECHFYIKLRDDDLLLIKKVKNFFKVGRISFQKESRPEQHDAYRYETTNLKEICLTIIPFFESHKLQSKRLIDFFLFKKIVRAVLNKEHQTVKGLVRIKKWKSEMHQYRAR